MDTFQKYRNQIAEKIYDIGLAVDVSNKYDIPTDKLIEIVNKSSWDIEIDKKKLIYYTRHKLMTAPQKIGLPTALGGTYGCHKIKAPMLIWYLKQLEKRGFKHDEMKLHIYNYFSKQLPPKPVDDTPMEERILYTFKLNKRIPVHLFTLEDFVLYTQKIQIPCWKLNVHRYEGNYDPFYRLLIPKRNITTQELNILTTLRTDKQFLKEEGYKVITALDGEIKIDYVQNLQIFKKYAMKSKDDSTVSYKDLLDKKLTYESI